MRKDTILLLAARLDDPVTGINAELAGLPLSPGDPVAPEIETVLNSIEHNDAAIDKVPDAERQAEDFPCALISSSADVDDIEPHVKPGPIRDGSVDVVIRIAELASAATGTRFAEDYLRAIGRVLDRFKAAPESERLRNSIYVMSCELMQPVTVWQSGKDTQVTTAMRTRWRVRDYAPLGA